MKFRAAFDTNDGRLTKGQLYRGGFVVRELHPTPDDICVVEPPGLRIVVFDNKGEWMTFDPKVFKPDIDSF